MIVSTSFLKDGNYSDFIKKLNESNTDMIHYDVMDGKFVDNTNLKTLSELTKYVFIHFSSLLPNCLHGCRHQ